MALIGFDDLMVRTICLNALNGQNSLSFGRDEGATVRLRAVQIIEAGTKFELKVDGHSFEGVIPLLGEHQAMNAAAAVAVGLALGIPVQEMLDGLASVFLCRWAYETSLKRLPDLRLLTMPTMPILVQFPLSQQFQVLLGSNLELYPGRYA